MSSTDEKLDKVLEIMLARNEGTPVTPVAPVVVTDRQRQEIGGWAILKVISSIALAVVTMLISAGMFWLIKTTSDTKIQVAANEQQRVSDRKLDNQKIARIETDLTEVKGNTKDRFTSKDADAKIDPVIDDVVGLKAEVAILRAALVERTTIISDTKTDIALLKRELGIKEQEKK